MSTRKRSSPWPLVVLALIGGVGCSRHVRPPVDAPTNSQGAATPEAPAEARPVSPAPAAEATPAPTDPLAATPASTHGSEAPPAASDGGARVDGVDLTLSEAGQQPPAEPTGPRLHIPYTDAGLDFCAMEIIEADGTRKPHRPPDTRKRCKERWRAADEKAAAEKVADEKTQAAP